MKTGCTCTSHSCLCQISVSLSTAVGGEEGLIVPEKLYLTLTGHSSIVARFVARRLKVTNGVWKVTKSSDMVAKLATLNLRDVCPFFEHPLYHQYFKKEFVRINGKQRLAHQTHKLERPFTRYFKLHGYGSKHSYLFRKLGFKLHYFMKHHISEEVNLSDFIKIFLFFSNLKMNKSLLGLIQNKSV